MIFNINNTYTRIEDCNILSELTKLCSFTHARFFRRRVSQRDIDSGKASRGQKWITERKEQTYNYFNQRDMTVPTGILYKIFKYLDNNNIKFDVKDKREKPEKIKAKPDFDMPVLRDYQESALERSVERERGILHMACNSGKTYVCIKLVDYFWIPTLYIVPNKTLLTQTYNLFKEYFGDYVGIIGGGKFDVRLINIATIQTLWTRFNLLETKKLLNSVVLLVYDEIHHLNFKSIKQLRKGASPFNTHYQIAMAMSNAYYRFGMSATIGNEGSLERGLLESCTGPVIYTTSQSQLIENSFSVKPRIKMICYNVEGEFPDWQTAYRELIHNNRDFNQYVVNIIEYYSNLEKSILIILTRTQTQMKILMELMPNALFIHGKTTDKQREVLLGEFQSGREKVLFSTVLNEGANLPAIDVLILPCGNKSLKLIEQRVGRSVRTRTGKESVTIIDFMFKGNKWLRNHSLERKRYFKGEKKFEFEMVEEDFFKKVDRFT